MDFVVTLRLAWRNVWRNPRRTLITGAAIALGLATMIFYLGFMEGMGRYMIASLIESGLGDAQLHAEGYRKTREPEIVIKNPGSLLQKAAGVPLVAAASPRIYGEGLLALGDRSAGVQIIGIDPARESKVTNWDERIIRGRMLASEKDAVLGRDLAGILDVDTGSRVVLTIADTVTGDLRYYLVTVSGIIMTNNPVMDKHTAILPLGLVQEGMGLAGSVHEIALAVDADPADRETIERAIEPFRESGIEAEPWQKLSPVLANMMELQYFYMSITLGIVFLLLSFGIVNTMSMSLFERMKEFGVLRALGTSPARLGALILAESTWLGVVGSFLGLLLGLGLHLVILRTGLTFGRVEAMGVSIEDPVYPVFKPLGVAVLTFIFVALTPLVALAVARKAGKINPAEALRHE